MVDGHNAMSGDNCIPHFVGKFLALVMPGAVVGPPLVSLNMFFRVKIEGSILKWHSLELAVLLHHHDGEREEQRGEYDQHRTFPRRYQELPSPAQLAILLR